MSVLEHATRGSDSPRVAMMQPTFLPWQGYFALIAACDTFVFLDDFQFNYRSYQHRNRIFSVQGDVRWLTLPVDRHEGTARATLLGARVLRDDPLYRKIVPSLQHAYGKSRYYGAVAPAIRGILDADWPSLGDLNVALIEACAKMLGIAPRFVRSSTTGSGGRRSARIAQLLETVGAKTYLSARGSFGYMKSDGIFPLSTIETRFLSFEPQPYPQRQLPDAFAPYLSVVDALMQVGPEETRALIVRGTRPFTPWAEMVEADVPEIEHDHAPEAP